MATPKWQAGKYYPPGSLVQPKTTQPAGALPAFNNPSFETGDATGWTMDPGVSVSNDNAYSGIYSAKFTGSSGGKRCFSDLAAAYPGMQVNATAQYRQGAASSGENVGWVTICWLDAAFALLREDRGNAIKSGSGGAWHLSSVTAVAPANTAWLRVCGLSERSDNDSSYFDDFTWANLSTVTQGLVYRAVQPATGLSGQVEPAWPPVNGVQVIDNEVIWEAVIGSRITWKARPILMSGPVEPVWKTDNQSVTVDNTIAWVLDTRMVTDPKCPNSPIAVLDQNKIYAADSDIIPFCAVNNAFDWNTENNAGYLPFGNGKYGANPVSALGLYRGRLMAFNSQGMQDWQIDPDPALNQRLNSLPIGCTFHKSYAPVANDAMMETAVGIRSLGLAASTSNLAIGDAGTAIDPLVKPTIYRGANKAPLQGRGIYIPSAGQYWLLINGYPELAPRRLRYFAQIAPGDGTGTNHRSKLLYSAVDLDSGHVTVLASATIEKATITNGGGVGNNGVDTIFALDFDNVSGSVDKIVAYRYDGTQNLVAAGEFSAGGYLDGFAVVGNRIYTVLTIGSVATLLAIDYDGVGTFTQVGSTATPAGTNWYHNVEMHGQYIIVNGGAAPQTVKAYTYDGVLNSFTEVGSMVIVGHLNEETYSGLDSDGEFLYVSNYGSPQEIAVYTFNGAVFTKVASLADPDRDTTGVYGGNGKIAVVYYDTYGSISMDIRSFDGTTIGPVENTIGGNIYGAQFYDSAQRLVFFPEIEPVIGAGENAGSDTFMERSGIYDLNKSMQLAVLGEKTTPTAIHWDSVVTTTINVSGYTGSATRFAIHLNIVHDNIGGVKITVTAPDGQSAVIKRPFYQDNPNPYIQSLLADFTNAVNDPNGDWVLKFEYFPVNGFDHGEGTLNSWSVIDAPAILTTKFDIDMGWPDSDLGLYQGYIRTMEPFDVAPVGYQPQTGPTTAFVYSISAVGKIGAWSRYEFPFPVSAAVIAEDAQGNTVLAVRSNDRIIYIHDNYLRDNMTWTGDPSNVDLDSGDDIAARIQWAWLEMGGQIGQDKNVEAVDLVGSTDGVAPKISMGWNQNDENAFTEPYQLPQDTIPGEPVAFELTAPSISVRLDYNGGNWKFSALNIYLQDRRPAR